MGDCIVVCLDTHALFAPNAKPLKHTQPNERSLYLNSSKALSGLPWVTPSVRHLYGYKVADSLIDQSLNLLAVLFLFFVHHYLDFRFSFIPKHHKCPHYLVSCHYVVHLFTLSLTLLGLLINRGGDAWLFCLCKNCSRFIVYACLDHVITVSHS